METYNRTLKFFALIGATTLVLSALVSTATYAASKPIPKPQSTNNRTVIYNDLDAAAITGAFALARGLPSPSNLPTLKLFLSNLKKNLNLISKSTLDIGVQGDILTEYIVNPKEGSSVPFCFTVKPPTSAKGQPGQAQWTFYMSPANGKLKDLIIIQQGYSTCALTAAFAKKIPSGSRTKYSQESLSLAKASVLRMPATLLTPMGLVMLDNARGISLSPTK